MATPITYEKCSFCRNFLNPEFKKDRGFRYYCKAYPDGNGIPVSTLQWKTPHTSVRENQVGDFIFQELTDADDE